MAKEKSLFLGPVKGTEETGDMTCSYFYLFIYFDSTGL
jgi:hypothetical protein